MTLNQISVFLENRTGELSAITRLLSENGVDLRALNIAETSDYGIIRFISNDQRKAAAILSAEDYVISVTPVSAVAVPDRPGGLCTVLKVLASANIDVSYMYSIFGQMNGMANMIFRVDEPEAMEELMKKNGLYLADATDLGIQ